MIIGIPAESYPDEQRVALVPAFVSNLIKAGLEVHVQQGAGEKAGFADSTYEEQGARLVAERSQLFSAADVLLQLHGLSFSAATSDNDLEQVHSGQTVIGMFNPLGSPETVQECAGKGLTTFALELLPRISRAQPMDVLSSMATIAGYKAVLLAAGVLNKIYPMMITAAGTITPSHVFVVGAGVAGLQAIATARRLGAKVEAFDVRPDVKEQIESLGAKFLETDQDVTGEGEGGYAKELSEEQHQRELELIAAHIIDTDLVITTAQIPGRPAPRLITEEMVDSMKPGSVIVDLAAASGGNCAITREGETVVRNGVKVMGPANLPAEVPFHASQMYAKNLVTFLKHLVDEGKIELDLEDDITKGALLTHGGQITNDAVKARAEGAN